MNEGLVDRMFEIDWGVERLHIVVHPKVYDWAARRGWLPDNVVPSEYIETGRKECPMKFGELLRRRREEAGRTLLELAGFLGLSQPYVSDVERGRRAPFRADRLGRIARYLETDFDELYDAALQSRDVFELDARDVTDQARRVGSLLVRKWPDLSDAELSRIQRVLEW